MLDALAMSRSPSISFGLCLQSLVNGVLKSLLVCPTCCTPHDFLLNIVSLPFDRQTLASWLEVLGHDKLSETSLVLLWAFFALSRGVFVFSAASSAPMTPEHPRASTATKHARSQNILLEPPRWREVSPTFCPCAGNVPQSLL